MNEALEKATDVLEACEAYFDQRADADCDQDGFVPNPEMGLLTDVRESLALLETLSASIAALKALQEQPAPVGVKPLEWWVSDTSDRCADTIIGRYQIQNVTANSRVRLFGPLCEIKPDEIGYWPEATAKAAAQADYERRILSALQPSPAREDDIETELANRAAERMLEGYTVIDFQPSPAREEAEALVKRLRAAFDTENTPHKNLALSKAAHFIAREILGERS